MADDSTSRRTFVHNSVPLQPADVLDPVARSDVEVRRVRLLMLLTSWTQLLQLKDLRLQTTIILCNMTTQDC